MRVSDRQSPVLEAVRQHQKDHERSRLKKTEHVDQKKPEIRDEWAKGKSVKEVTYQKPAAIRDEKSVQRLMADGNRAYEHLRELVIRLLERQGFSAERLRSDGSPVFIDQEARTELEALLSTEGDLGIEKTSDRIVDFAIALSGGDKEKAGLLKEAIIQGFREAEKTLGGLPEISLKTYERVMEKFEAWVKSE